MSEPEGLGASPEAEVPGQPLSGAEFGRVGWTVLRARWQSLAPTIAVTALVIAILDIALSVWVFGSVAAATANKFDPATALYSWAINPQAPSDFAIGRSITAAVLTGLLLPVVATVTAGAVVDDAARGVRSSAGVYFARGMVATPASIGATAAAVLIAAAPIVAVGVITSQGQSNSSQSAALLFLGTPALLWLAIASIRWSLAPQAVAIEKCSSLAALRRSWNLSRGNGMRIAAITIVTGLVSAIASTFLAAPVTALGTLSASGQNDASSGKVLSEHFLATLVSAFVATTITSIIAALLFIDLRRRLSGQTAPAADQ